MCKILLPIKTKYINAIFNGEKTFELRRSIPKRTVDEIIVYETSPVSKIVGKLFIKKTYKMNIFDLWEKTKNKNHISKKDFFNYFKGKKVGYTFEIKSYKKYKRKINKEKYKINFFPQNFVYIN